MTWVSNSVKYSKFKSYTLASLQLKTVNKVCKKTAAFEPNLEPCKDGYHCTALLHCTADSAIRKWRASRILKESKPQSSSPGKQTLGDTIRVVKTIHLLRPVNRLTMSREIVHCNCILPTTCCLLRPHNNGRLTSKCFDIFHLPLHLTVANPTGCHFTGNPHMLDNECDSRVIVLFYGLLVLQKKDQSRR